MTQNLVAALACALIAAPVLAAPDDTRIVGTIVVDTRAPQARKTVKARRAWANRFQESRRGPEVTDQFSRTVRVGAAGSVEVSNMAGDITVTGGGGDQVRIDAVKRVRSREQSDAKALLDDLRIEVNELPNRVEVRTIYPQQRRNYSGSVDYTIGVPAGTAVTLKTMSGDLRVTNVKGELRAETMSGSIIASGATTVPLAKTASGEITISNVNGDGVVNASILSGSLRLTGVKTRSLDLSSVSGDVIASDVTCDRARVKTMSGNVEYAGALGRTGRYEMTAHSGNVRLTVANTAGFELEATTFSGEVRSDLPLTTLRAGNAAPARRPHRANRSIRGSFGDGGAVVHLTSFSGNIVVTK